MNKDDLKCPICGFDSDVCDFPDFFSEGKEHLTELCKAGFNIVSCGMCGDVFIQKLGAKND